MHFIPEFLKLTHNISFATFAHVTLLQGQETLEEEKYGTDPVAIMTTHTQTSRCSCENYVRKEVRSFLTCQEQRTLMMSSLSDMKNCV